MLLLVILAAVIQRSFAGGNLSETLQGLLATHDHRIRPDHEGPATNVSLFVYVESLGPLQERTMDFSASFYLGMDWADPTLTFTGEKYIVLKGKDIEMFWIPDVFFLYEKDGHSHDIVQANQTLKILPSGNCRYIVRVSLKAVCQMTLHRFPFDKQICSIHMLSFAYTYEDLILTITDDAVIIDPMILVSKYDFRGLSTETFEVIPDEYINETWHGVVISFAFKRQLQTYVLTVYVPSLLLVIISWMSFWIDAHAAPARITLGITTVMTATTMTASMQEDFPDGEEAKAIDIWLAACLIFVFLSLIEYAFTNYLIVIEERRKKKTKAKEDISRAKQDADLNLIRTIFRNEISTNFGTNNHGNGLPTPAVTEKYGLHPSDSSPPALKTGLPKFMMLSNFNAEQMDKLARVLFGLAFVIFNLYYWIVYVYLDPDK